MKKYFRAFTLQIMGIVKNVCYTLSNSNQLKSFSNQSIFPYYHIVSNSSASHITSLYHYKNVKQFKCDLDVLLSHFKPLDVDILKSPPDSFSIPKNHFLLTFDDGLSQVYDVIYPILLSKGINAIFFVNPKFVGNNELFYKHKLSIILNKLEEVKDDKNINEKIIDILNVKNINHSQLASFITSLDLHQEHKRNEIASVLNLDFDLYLKKHIPYLKEDQIQEMIRVGFNFGGHTISHPYLPSLDFREQVVEIISSIEWLKEKFELPYSFFSFPFTDKGISKQLVDEIFKYDDKAILFGNSGIRKESTTRFIQRFSLDDPSKKIEKRIISEIYYKYYNQLIGKYKIKRK